MKVLAAYYTHKPGGMCQRLYRCLNALTSRGHSVTYLTLDRPAQKLNEVEVRLFWFPFRARSGLVFWILFLLFAPLQIAWRALKMKPDRFVAFGAFYSTLMLPARILSPSSKLILFLRSLVFRTDKINNKPLAVRAVSNLVDLIGILWADKVICMTNAMIAAIKEFTWGLRHDFLVLPNDLPPINQGTSLRKELGISDDMPLILTSGVIDQNKNIGVLLEAISQVSIPCVLVIVGDGPGKAALEQQKARLALQNVYLPGWIEGLSSKLSGVTITVHPSRTEGVSNSILESLAAGIPVLASDTPEMKELLRSEELLFCADAPKSLAEKIIYALQNLSHVGECSQKAAQAYSFDWDSNITNIILEQGPPS